MTATILFQGRPTAPGAFEQGCQRARAALQAAGVGPGDVVALMLRNEPLTLELMVAVRTMGAQWCPVNWHFKTDEVAYILADSGARVFIVDSALLAALQGLPLQGVQTWVVPVEGAPSNLLSWPALRDAAAADSLPPAPLRGAMFYTSGTTGRPKGIQRAAATPQQAVQGQAVMRHVLGFEPGMRALLSAPLYHSAPNSYGINAVQEAELLVLEARFDAERTLALIEEHRITHAYLVPTMYVRLLRLPAAVRQRYDLRSMRYVASTGSPCPPDVKRAMIAWWGPVIHEAYGSSELGYMTRLDSEQALRKPGSAGPPLPGVTLAILDDEGRPQPSGRAGSIYVHQPAFADFTYIGNDASRQRMERNGLKTLGDVGYLDEDGFLFIVDRAADMVISGGVNIYPAEIEAVLQAMPGVVDCAVFGVPDTEFGEALLAAVQAEPGAEVDAAAVQAFLKTRLADYKVPRQVVLHAQLPREDTGKVFKRRLREPYWAGMSRRV